MKRLWVSLLVCCIIIASSQQAYPRDVKSSNVNELIEEALKNNPHIQAAYNRWKAAAYRVKNVSAIPDPIGKYTYLGESIETRIGPQEHKYALSQTIPFPMKLYLKGKSAVKEREMLKEEYEAAKRDLIKDINFVYYDLYWLDKAQIVLNEEKTVLESLEKVARVKFETGYVPQQDVIRVGVEISKIIDRILTVKQQRKSKEAMMNSLLNRPKRIPLEPIEDIGFEEFSHELDQLRKIASKSRQELIEANLNVEKAKYEKSLSQLNFIPDFTFGFDYISVGSGSTVMSNDGRDAWMTTFAVNIPLWFDKLYTEIKEKEMSLKAAEHDYDDTKNRVTYEIEDIYFKIVTYKDIVSLYKTALLPQTEQAFEAGRTGYESGKVDFLDWLDSERVLLQTRLAYYKAIADYQKSIAYLERIIGTDI
ncbi:MAG: TolC family protein [Candidatus Omnitrophica bacterium]|nr:TolC family protein [Candidatus Omnitrophota bacterium]